jgi:Ca2+-binding RTX toxin-like protein
LGNDLLVGGNGDDTYVVDSLEDQIIDLPGTGIETIRASVSWNLPIGIEHLFLIGNAQRGVGNDLDNFIRGNSLGNLLEGGNGNDTIFGDELESKLFNGVEFERFVSYKAFFQAVLTSQYPAPGKAVNLSSIEGYQNLAEIYISPSNLPPGGDDVLKGGNGNDKLFGWTGNDSLYGEAGNDWLFGGYGNDVLFGGEGNDRLDGEQGADRLIGGNGNDLYVIDNLYDVIVDIPLTGTETVESRITFDLRKFSMATSSPIINFTGLENLTLADTVPGEVPGENPINGFGNNLANILTGNSSDNTLDGREGDDTVNGGAGNDILIVSQGNDVLFGGGGADKFRFNAMPGTFDKATIQDFAPGEDVIEISKSAFGNPTLSQFSFSPLGSNSVNLFLGNRLLVTVNSSSPFSISNNVKLI